MRVLELKNVMLTIGIIVRSTEQAFVHSTLMSCSKIAVFLLKTGILVFVLYSNALVMGVLVFGIYRNSDPGK